MSKLPKKRFQKNDVLVPVDATYPEGALVADGYDDSGSLLAHPLGGGFQFIVSAEKSQRLRVLTADEREMRVFRRTRFALEGIEDTFEGWTDGQRWNGWAMPFFERSQADRVAATLDARYDGERDAYVTVSSEEEEEPWEVELIVISDGTTTKAYPIGAGAWIWEEDSDESQ